MQEPTRDNPLRTRKELLDYVERKLVEQGGPSAEGYSCKYRGDKGRRCGVGWLISDEAYVGEIEGRLAVEVLEYLDLVDLESLGNEDAACEFLANVQVAHDQVALSFAAGEPFCIGTWKETIASNFALLKERFL